MNTTIVIAKYNNTGKTLWASDQLIDRILFNNILDADFPLFKYESETIGTIKKRKAGDFAISFTYNSNVKSFNDNSVTEFFRGGTNNYLYWFGINIYGLEFSGKFDSTKIISDFTITEGKYECTVIIKDILYDWGEYAINLNNKYNISPTAFPTFEDYIKTHHLNQLITEPSNVITPAESLEAKCGQVVRFHSEFYHLMGGYGAGGSVDWEKVNRMETWEGLARGLGFDYDLALNDTLENIYNDLSFIVRIKNYYNLVIKWKDDIYNENPYTITKSIIHREYTVPVSKNYVFIGYRHHIYPGLSYYTIINGILYSLNNLIDTDTLQQEKTAKPYFQIDTGYDQFLNYLAPQAVNFVKYLRDTEINGVDLGIYNCVGISKGGNHIHAGAIAYARLFCNPDNLEFTNVQRYVIKSYSRYSSSIGLKGKEIEVPISDVPGISLYKPLIINDGDGDKKYEVDQIEAINIKNKTIKLKIIELPIAA